MSHVLAARLQAMAPSQICQAFFALSTGLLVLGRGLPSGIGSAILDYGPRRQSRSPSSRSPSSSSSSPSSSSSSGAFAILASCAQVPHSWFLHFYVVSVSWSAFWAWQFLCKGRIMESLASAQVARGESGMDMGQVVLVWALMASQGARRLYESLYVSKPGKSPMLSAHWIMGLLYYAAIGIAVWIEGSDAILRYWQSPQPLTFLTPKTAPASVLFFLACYSQNKCHRYLASLKKYTLPDKGSFRRLVCPHYTYECLLYVALAMAAAPPGKTFNKTMLSGLLFIVVNLSITANTTKTWYAGKFGQDKVAGKWRIIPFLY